mmetsp:Transcript_21506/g.50068  ORF Transcript_21506/g.50068 Transcript_21506/m.50068 type:complete len:96 (+) Transcript_21506:1039-1326(+)
MRPTSLLGDAGTSAPASQSPAAQAFAKLAMDVHSLSEMAVAKGNKILRFRQGALRTDVPLLALLQGRTPIAASEGRHCSAIRARGKGCNHNCQPP